MLAAPRWGFEPMQHPAAPGGQAAQPPRRRDGGPCRPQRCVCRYFCLREGAPRRRPYETHREGHSEPARLVYTIQQRSAGLTGSQTWKAPPRGDVAAHCAAAPRGRSTRTCSGIYRPTRSPRSPATTTTRRTRRPVARPRRPGRPTWTPTPARLLQPMRDRCRGSRPLYVAAGVGWHLPALRLRARPAGGTTDRPRPAVRRVADPAWSAAICAARDRHVDGRPPWHRRRAPGAARRRRPAVVASSRRCAFRTPAAAPGPEIRVASLHGGVAT